MSIIILSIAVGILAGLHFITFYLITGILDNRRRQLEQMLATNTRITEILQARREELMQLAQAHHRATNAEVLSRTAVLALADYLEGDDISALHLIRDFLLPDPEENPTRVDPTIDVITEAEKKLAEARREATE